MATSTDDDRLLSALEESGLDVKSAREVAEVQGWLNTGNYALNFIISGRFNLGYPLGHVVEIFGDPSSGKSYLIARAIAEAQRQGGAAVLDDTEGRFSAKWSERALGVDVDALGVKKSDTVEEHHHICSTFLDCVTTLADEDETPVPYVLGLDSLGELTTKEELEGDFGDPGMLGARRAKMIRRLYREVGKRISDVPIAYLVANHTYTKIGGWGSPKESVGGGGLKFKSSVRLDLRTPSKLKDGKEVVGVRIRAVVEKNSISVPYRECSMTIPFQEPISPYSGLIPVLLNLGILGTSGHTMTYEGEDTGIYTQKTNPLKQDKSAEELVEEFPDILEKTDKILEEREEALHNDGVVEE